MPLPKFLVDGVPIWHMVRHSTVVYRNGIVAVMPPNSSFVQVKPNGFKGGTTPLYYYQGAIPKEAIKTPPGTNFLTEVQGLSSLFYDEYGVPITIFKCTSKAQGAGESGYVIVPRPSRMDCVDTFRKEWKTWMVEPKVKALLSFLTYNLEEILSVSTILQKKEYKSEG